MNRFKSSLVWTMSILVPGLISMADASPAETLLQTGRPLVIGHRGYLDFAPENTLASIELALAAKVDLVEFDYVVSRDGVPFVIHDRTLDRTTDSVAKLGREGIRVADVSSEDLLTLDAGSWFSPRFADERLPKLAETLDYIQERGGMALIDHKTGEAADLVDLLKQRGMINHVIIQSFQWDYLRAIRALAPEQVVSAAGPPRRRMGRVLSNEERALSPSWIDEVVEAGFRVICWNEQVTTETVDYAHAKGLRVWVYTINDKATAQSLYEIGVDGIITDNPAVIWRAMALREVK